MINEKSREKIPGFLKNFYRSFVIALRLPLAKFRASPDFIIIGVQKGGTSSLIQLLKQHKHIRTSFFKEVHYYDLNYDKGSNWYKAFFPFKKNGSYIYGEASPYYIFHPGVPERVYKDNPATKLILLLRDPIDRCYSQFQMERRKGKEKLETFEDAIAAEETRTKISIDTNNNDNFTADHQTYTYLARGRYKEQIDRWLKYFSKDQLLIIQSEKFFADPVGVTTTVHSFLGVEPISPKDTRPKNKGEYLPVKDSTIQFLRTYFKPYNMALSEFLNETFDWK